MDLGNQASNLKNPKYRLKFNVLRRLSLDTINKVSAPGLYIHIYMYIYMDIEPRCIQLGLGVQC